MLRKYNITGILRENVIYFDDKTFKKELVDIKKMFISQGIDVSKNWDDENLDFSKFVIWFNEKGDLRELFFYRRLNFNDHIDRGNNFLK